MLDSQLVPSLLVSRIDFSKYINEPLDEDFIHPYQSHVGIYMWAYVCI